MIETKRTVPEKIAHRLSRHGILVFVILLYPVAPDAFAQNPSPAAALKAAIDAELRSPLLKRTVCAVLVRAGTEGKTLYERNADLLLRPASTTKLVTSGAALLSLPASYRFVTACFISRASSGSAELWIRGAGDPLFTLKDLESLADQVAAAGAAGIAAIHLDGSIFDTTYYGEGWMWDDETDPGIPYISAFPFSRNRLTVTVSASERIRMKADVSIDPPCDSIIVQNMAYTGMTDNISVSRLPRTNVVRVWGTVKRGGLVKESISMWSPDGLLGCAFAKLLSARGLQAAGCTFDRLPVPEGLPMIARVERTLDEVLGVMNKQSDNLCAESLLKIVAHAGGDQPGTAFGGLQAGKRLFAGNGVDSAGIALVDGSGISFYNLITPRALSDILAAMLRSNLFPRYLRSLAVPGTEGTLASRYAGEPSAQYIHAKTGTLRGVSTLAGYVILPDAPPLTFVIFMQNFTGPHRPYRELQDKIVRRCLEYSRAATRAIPSR